MDSKDRACFNCDACFVKKVPIVGVWGVKESNYWGLVSCRQRLSDHYKHYIELDHVCAWHSDSVKDDDRYPNWRDSIDLPSEVANATS